MTVERILQAAVNSMTAGHHAPHCYAAHIPGKGYINSGDTPGLRPDYLRQLQRAAQQEVENMRYAEGYAEPGYEQPEQGVLFANWNVFPSRLDTTLEKAGYAVEWSDEWETCEHCNKAVRTSPDSFCWRPAYSVSAMQQGAVVCLDCRGGEDIEADAALEAAEEEARS